MTRVQTSQGVRSSSRSIMDELGDWVVFMDLLCSFAGGFCVFIE